MRLKDKVAIITGAARGIGEATAILFAREGAKVVVADKRQEEGEKVTKQIKDLGGEAIFVRVDITDENQVKEMVETTVKTYGTVNVLVNNAGTFALNRLHDTTNEQWDLVMNTDVRGYFWCSKYVIPHMIKVGGGQHHYDFVCRWVGCRARFACLLYRQGRYSRVSARDGFGLWAR